MKCGLVILLLVCCGPVMAQNALQREVKLMRRQATVGQVLTELNTIPDLVISYSSIVVDISRQVIIDDTPQTVGEILRAVLRGQSVRLIEQEGKILIAPLGALKKKYTISGFVTDRKSGERLIGATIFIPEKNWGTTSNVYGFYSITLDEAILPVQISYSGYQGFQTDLSLDKNINLDVQLEPVVTVIETVVVNSDNRKNSASRSVGKNDMPANFIKSVPALMGEADVFKSLQLLPGVQAGNEGSSGLNVRGGSPDQNLILIDGVPVYNASHAFGLFSVFNADAVNSVEIMKSGFPASYGGRLSSVIDVHMKEGDKNHFHGEGGIGLVFSKITLEGPIKKGRSSFLISGRRTYFDLLFKPLINAVDGQTEFAPYFSDLNAKANFPLGKRDRIYLSLYTGTDAYYSSDTRERTTDTVYTKNKYIQGLAWGNVTGLLRWNHTIGNKIFSNLTLTYSRYRFRYKTISQQESNQKSYQFLFDQRYFSGIQDLNLKLDIDYLPHPDHFVKLGMSSILHHYEPGVSTYLQKDTIVKADSRVDNHSLYGLETDVYVEDDIRISDRTKLNAGLRFGSFLVSGKLMASAQPRLNAVYRLTKKFNLKASAGTMRQFIHLLANSNLGLPTDLWLPVTRRIPPQRAYQFTGGISYRHNGILEASMELYYKKMKNVIDYSEGSGFGSAYNNWEDMVEIGQGKAYGVEWLLQKKKGRITGLVGYTLGKSTRQFDGINGGRVFPYKYDRRHEVKTAIIWKPANNFEMGANWIFSTGNAISLPVAYYFNPVTSKYIDIYTARNNYRMRNYHRLDVSLRWSKQKKHHTRIWTFSVYNAYNRFNPFFIYKNDDLTGNTSNIEFREMSVFPLMPSFSYQFKF